MTPNTYPTIKSDTSHHVGNAENDFQGNQVGERLAEIHERIGRASIHDSQVREALSLLDAAVGRGYDVVRERAADIVKADQDAELAKEDKQRNAGTREYLVPRRSVEKVQATLLAMYGLKPEARISKVDVAKALDDISGTIEGLLRGQSNRIGDRATNDARLFAPTFTVSKETGFSDDDISTQAPEYDHGITKVLEALAEKLDNPHQSHVKHAGHRTLRALGISMKSSRQAAIESATDEIIALYGQEGAAQIDTIAREMLLRNGYEEYFDDFTATSKDITRRFHARMESSYVIVKAAKQFSEMKELNPRFTDFEAVLLKNGGEPQRLGLDSMDEEHMMMVLDKYDEVRKRSGSQKLAVQRLGRAFHSDTGDSEELFSILSKFFPNNKPPLISDES